MTKIQDIIDSILADIPGAPLSDTVDTVKCGDPKAEVTGIVTTFLASIEVIRRTIGVGANLIITHEPTFYDNTEQASWVIESSTYNAKRDLLLDNEIVVWRFHDHWHLHQPDGIRTGVAQTLGWQDYADPAGRSVYTFPTITLSMLVQELRSKLDIDQVRVVGNSDMACSSAALKVGAPSSEWQMRALTQDDVDVLITGEVREWETSEYVRDMNLLGLNKALIVLGHAKSEEPGMRYLVDWLQPMFPDVQITHIPVGDAFLYM